MLLMVVWGSAWAAIYIAILIGVDRSCRLWSDTLITNFRFGDNCAG